MYVDGDVENIIEITAELIFVDEYSILPHRLLLKFNQKTWI
jgi:hypothetical protein